MCNARTAVTAMACAAWLTSCNTGGGGGSSNTGPTPTPIPGAVLATPNPMVLSLSGVGNPKSVPQIAFTQANATGQATITTTCISSPPLPADVLSPTTSTTQNLANGLLSGNFGPISALNAGSCGFTITPATGLATGVAVKVNP